MARGLTLPGVRAPSHLSIDAARMHDHSWRMAIRLASLPLCLLIGLTGATSAHAQTQIDESIEVLGSRPGSVRAIRDSGSTVRRDTIERRQPLDLYETIGDTAGVAIEGGPRSSGKTISIRGFSDNEDILTRIDGATQNFEKYRYGSSLEIDPDLVRQVDILRGAATLVEGAGALGGIVLAETLDAGDLLRPGQRYGVRTRLAYTTNDDGQRGSVSVYGRPLDNVDLLASGVMRETNALELPDRSRLADSAEALWSGLFKASGNTAYGEWRAVHRRGEAERLEPFDASGGAPGLFGTVRRRTEDAATVLGLRSNTGRSWRDAEATLGYTDKRVTDLASRTAGGTALGTDEFDYGIWTLDLRNDVGHRWGAIEGSLRVGLQGNRELRTAVRTNALGRRVNEAQPPGAKKSWGGVLFETLRWGDVEINGGARFDHYQVDAKATSARLLRAQARDTDAGFTRLSPGAGMQWTPRQGPFSLFYSYAETFRAPLVDEYYTLGVLSRCQSFSRYAQRPSVPAVPASFNLAVPGPPGSPASFPSLAAFLAALDAYLAAQAAYDAALAAYLSALEGFNVNLQAFGAAMLAYQANPNAADYAMCGSDYQPELAFNHELGAAYDWGDVWQIGDLLRVRLVRYRIKVEQTLESIYEGLRTGDVRQQGQERRRGYELELDYDATRWFASFALTTLDGEFDLRYFDNNRNSLVAAATTAADRGAQPLNSVPANRLSFTAGHRWPVLGVELGYRLQAVDSRLVITGTRDGCPAGLFILPSCNEIGAQRGYLLHGGFLRWQPHRRVAFTLTGDNLTNTEYQLTGFGGGLGITAPGRDVRLSVAVQY